MVKERRIMKTTQQWNVMERNSEWMDGLAQWTRHKKVDNTFFTWYESLSSSSNFIGE